MTEVSTEQYHSNGIRKCVNRILKCIDNQCFDIVGSSAFQTRIACISKCKCLCMKHAQDDEDNSCKRHTSGTQTLPAWIPLTAIYFVVLRACFPLSQPDRNPYPGVDNKNNDQANPGYPEQGAEIVKHHAIGVHGIR